MPKSTSGKAHFAFYVSGHGFGHATRASALTSSLLLEGHCVTIVTNAPPHCFSGCLPAAAPSAQVDSKGESSPRYATYRQAKVDAGIVQPKAYDVDRKATYDVLKAFMEMREATIQTEAVWLTAAGIDCVLSDSTYIGCAAALEAKIPSLIVSNFTFDSCYSYLSLPALVASSMTEEPEPPIPEDLLEPLVKQSIADYSCASLLIRLPGVIPIPAFDTDVTIQSSLWVNAARTSFTDAIEAKLERPASSIPAGSCKLKPEKKRRVIDVPLIVRPPSPKVHTREFREELLTSMKVPRELFDSKILLVSFGGQSIPRPRSRPPSPLSSPLQRTASSNWSSTNSSTPNLLGATHVTNLEAGLLPKGWIAIVCGLSGNNNEIRNKLPEGFFASEKDVYVPDLTATADVVLGKLGYGTCSESLSNKTPFIYVPRPLFIEEFGLKRMMESRGTALELDRADFEGGRWEFHIVEAYERGKAAKEEAKRLGFIDENAGAIIVKEIERFVEEYRS